MTDAACFLYALFYAITGLAASWFYRRFIGRSVKSTQDLLILLGLMPMAAPGCCCGSPTSGSIGLSVATEANVILGAGSASVA